MDAVGNVNISVGLVDLGLSGPTLGSDAWQNIAVYAGLPASLECIGKTLEAIDVDMSVKHRLKSTGSWPAVCNWWKTRAHSAEL